MELRILRRQKVEIVTPGDTERRISPTARLVIYDTLQYKRHSDFPEWTDVPVVEESLPQVEREPALPSLTSEKDDL